MEIFWVNKLPSSEVSLVIPGAPTLYDRIYGRSREDRERILRCFMNIKSEIDIDGEHVDVQSLKPVDVLPTTDICLNKQDYNNVKPSDEQSVSRDKNTHLDLLSKLRRIGLGGEK